MDKRVVKTKRTIKRTLVELLATMPFEKITVTDAKGKDSTDSQEKVAKYAAWAETLKELAK